jgi:hypothetical protein
MQQSLDYGYTAAGAGPGANWASGSDLNSVNQFLQGGWLGNGDWMASVNAFNAANGGRAVDPRYGLNDLWQDPLSVRLGFRFNF